VALAGAALLGCARWQPLPAHPVRSAASYPSAQTRGALVVAIEPLLDPARAQRSLGTDLLRDEQVLGLLVVIENRDPDASRLLLPDAVSVAAPAPVDVVVPDTERESLVARDAAAAADTLLEITAAVFPPLLIGYIPFATVMGRSVSASRFTRHRLLRASLRAHTISPGEREHGFVFLPLSELRAAGEPVALVVDLTDPSTRAAERFEFPLEVPPANPH
jgi:hypothetical protein